MIAEPTSFYTVNVSYLNVVKPLELDDQTSESRTIMEALESILIDKVGNDVFYFEVDYPLGQKRTEGYCDLYDELCDDIVQLNLWYS